MHSMALVSDEAQVQARFGPIGDSANLDRSLVHSLHRTYQRLRNRFGRTRWNSQGTCVMWNVILVRSEIVLVSVQDRCTTCAKCTIGSKIVLDALDGSAR